MSGKQLSDAAHYGTDQKQKQYGRHSCNDRQCRFSLLLTLQILLIMLRGHGLFQMCLPFFLLFYPFFLLFYKIPYKICRRRFSRRRFLFSGRFCGFFFHIYTTFFPCFNPVIRLLSLT